MIETLLIAVTIISLGTFLILFLVWLRSSKPSNLKLDAVLRDELRLGRDESSKQSRELREEVINAQTTTNDSLVRTINALGENQKELMSGVKSDLGQLAENIQSNLVDIQKENESRFDRVRHAVEEKLKEAMTEQKKSLTDVVGVLREFEKTHKEEQDKARETLEKKFNDIQEANEKKLEEMRKTVDEKLHDTLEKRLGESFKLVGAQLEAVQKGLGEMQNLATGVGDLKRVLTNVKERGTWGEYQLGAILEQVLAPSQYERNVKPKDGGESVEFAVKLPGRDQEPNAVVWLPIDSKFPKEDYERLLDAAQRADSDGVKDASKNLVAEIIRCAKDISGKYLEPPKTTDFAIMFLPTEGLYAEVLRQPGLQDDLQLKYRVLVAGPTTLSAILNSLRIGFQTLAIEKRASEVWSILGAVKSEFAKFGAVLDKVKKQLNTASKTIDESAKRSRAMERKLRSVEELPTEEAAKALGLTHGDLAVDGEDELESEEKSSIAETP